LLSREEFIRISLEINLFFQRIMKEHLFFIETNLQPVEPGYIREARALKQGFEELLAETVRYANGVISEKAISSNEIVTPYTLRAEEVTSRLTGASINTSITRAELELVSNNLQYYGERLENIVSNLNTRSLNLLERVIAFQKELLAQALECRIFITLYHEMLEHDTREAVYYFDFLRTLQQRRFPRKALCEELNFWNNIMGEHAQFIDGMLDPTERNLKQTAEGFARRFERLVEECIQSAERQIRQESLETTQGIRDYKRTATVELLRCQIKSIIPPLLADHVLREANHYLRILRMQPYRES
jgi:hypothetical protein